jgi:serine/threonine-protein kinase
LEAGQYEVARAAAERWLQLLPEDEEAKALLARVEKSTIPEVQETPPTDAAPPPVSQSTGETSSSVRREPSPTRKGIPVWGWALGLLALVALGIGVLRGQAPEEPTAMPTISVEDAAATDTLKPSPTSAAPEAFVAGDTRTRETDGMTMVYVPAGEFEMGSTEGDDGEEPVHMVALDAFWLDQTEVSVAQFRQFVAATDHETMAEERGGSWAYTGNGWEEVEGADWAHPRGSASQAEDDHPVVHVSWHDADAYCAWAGGRLPTEAEWEYAARGSESLIYPWGNEFDCSRGNFDDETFLDDYVVPGGAGCDGYNRTAPVGSFPEGASWVDAYDLSGNVWEWVADWYGEDYYDQSPRENPTGPISGDYRVLRGGSWYNSVRLVRGANRNRGEPPYTRSSYGFRCVAVAAPGD